MRELPKIAPKLAKNPLGIIALFIVLIYGFAALVVGATGDSITADQRWPLIWFLVLFPVGVLLVFAWLVIKHHKKLYAPSDFQDEGMFMGLMSSADRIEKLEREIEAIEPEVTKSAELEEAERVTRPLTARGEYEDVRSKFMLAEKLALRHVARTSRKKVHENVYFGLNKRRGSFDGAIIDDSLITVIEVKFVRRPFIPISMIDATLCKAESISSELKDSHLKLRLIFVTEMSKEQRERLERLVDRRIDRNLVDVEVDFFDFTELAKEQGAEHEKSNIQIQSTPDSSG